MADHSYNLANIRELLLQGFSTRELRNICYDTPDFQTVHNDLHEGSSKAEIVQKLIASGNRNLTMDKLLSIAKERNPRRYSHHGPYDFRDAIGPAAGDSVPAKSIIPRRPPPCLVHSPEHSNIFAVMSNDLHRILGEILDTRTYDEWERTTPYRDWESDTSYAEWERTTPYRDWESDTSYAEWEEGTALDDHLSELQEKLKKGLSLFIKDYGCVLVSMSSEDSVLRWIDLANRVSTDKKGIDQNRPGESAKDIRLAREQLVRWKHLVRQKKS